MIIDNRGFTSKFEPRSLSIRFMHLPNAPYGETEMPRFEIRVITEADIPAMANLPGTGKP